MQWKDTEEDKKWQIFEESFIKSYIWGTWVAQSDSWFSSVHDLISRLWDQALHPALCWAWSLLGILSLHLPLPLPFSFSKQTNKQTNKFEMLSEVQRCCREYKDILLPLHLASPHENLLQDHDTMNTTKKLTEAPGWLSRLSIQLRLRSWSHGWWVWAPHRALCWWLGPWSLFRILCLPLSLTLPRSCSVSLCIKNK